MPSGTVLHVDPEREAREALRDALTETDLEVRSATSVEDGTAALRADDVACLVAEHNLSDGTGTDLVRRARETSPDIGCVLYTDAPREAVATGADDGPTVAEYVPKDAAAGVDRVAQLVRTTADRRTQAAYPLPDGEADRLALLEALDFEGDPLEAALERVADLARAHFDLPLATVSYVGSDAQEFLVCRGDDWSAVDREMTVCTYTILEDGTTVVEDLAEDPRFVANEALEELGIRFYAGATLSSREGLPVGTLCVYDETPQSFDEDDAAYLELLAEDASHWIERCGRDGQSDAAPEGVADR